MKLYVCDQSPRGRPPLPLFPVSRKCPWCGKPLTYHRVVEITI